MNAKRFSGIPVELRALPQWVVSATDGRPISALTGRSAKSNDPRTWATFDEAAEACEARGPDYLPAFALTADDPYCAVDLDDKPDRPASPETRALFDTIVAGLDSYTEQSRSGRGIHVVVRAELPAPLKTANVEVFDRAHFVTLTGHVFGKRKPIREQSDRVAQIVAELRPAKPPVMQTLVAGQPDQADAEVLERAAVNPKFAALNAGDWDGYASQSEADLAYVGMLWNASGNAEQVKRLWRASPLAQRPKGQRDDYVAGMLAKVTQSPARIYNDDDPASLFSDTANAQRVAHHMGGHLVFVPGIGWHVWDGARWRCDPLEARRHVGKLGAIVMREAGEIAVRDQSDNARELSKALMKFAGQSENVPKIEAAMKAAEPLLRCDPDTLDADPWLLGCANGTVDLRTGELLPPDPARMLTKSTGHEFDPDAKCPTWEAFLARIFRGHPELPAFMQRLAGYWLTGLTDPPYLAVLYGSGSNGKSTLVYGIQLAMGEYAGVAARGLLVKRYGEQHTTDIAALQGKRFIVASESAEGAKLDEDKVKALTGSDRITARYMRENNFTFTPTFKVAMQTNHKPAIAGTDEGIWRRIRIIPFDEMIAECEQDPDLKEKLRNEAPGILRWAVDGACMFANGRTLGLPDVVTEATRAYRTESDVLGEFIAEQCDVDAKASVASSDLFSRYAAWCGDTGERSVSKKALGLRMQDRGFKPKTIKNVRSWIGLSLKRPPKHRQ